MHLLVFLSYFNLVIALSSLYILVNRSCCRGAAFISTWESLLLPQAV